MGLTQITTGGVDENINIDNNTLKVDGTNNRVGIGTASPVHTLHLFGSAGTQLRVQSSAPSAYIAFQNSSAGGGYVGYQGDNLTLWTGATERFRVDSAGRVGIGIGNTSMSSFTGNASDNLVVGSGSGGEGITVYSATNNQGSLTFADGTSGDAAYRGAVEYNHTNDRLAFRTAGTGNRMVIDSSGRLGLGTTSPNYLLTALAGSGSQNIFQAGQTGVSNGYTISSNGSALTHQWYAGSGEAARIDSSGNVLVGTTDSTIYNNGDSDSEGIVLRDGEVIDIARKGDLQLTLNRQTNDGHHIGFFRSGSAKSYIATRNDGFCIDVNGSEALRIDSSKNLLLGSTSNARGKLTIFNGDDFSTGTLNNGDNIYLVSDATSGNNVYGASIAFSRVQYPDRKAAAIASVQTSSDEDHVGLAFFTHPSSNASDAIVEAMRIKSDGTLHVLKSGTHISNAEQTCAVFQRSSASGSTSKISIVSGNAASSHINFGDTDDEDTGMIAYVHSTNAMQFHTNGGTERMRLDSAGNLGVGSSSPGAKLDVAGNVLLSAANPKITFNSGGANIHAPAANTLAFNTDGSNERLRIHSLGRVLIGRAISADPWLASGNVDAGQYFGSGNNFGAAINSRDIPLILNRTNTTGSIQEFKYNGSTTGFISTTSSAITISYSSDYRLKENVIPLADAITRVKQLQPKRFNYIIDPGVTVDGFIAHEAQTVVPEAVVGTHNQVDDNGDPVYQGIDPSKMVPLLTAALKEAIAKIETLETKVAALEAAQ